MVNPAVTLYGHGYVGTAIADALNAVSADYEWRSHTDPFLPNGDIIINAAGFTGVPNVDACEARKADTLRGNVLWPIQLDRHRRGQPVIHLSSGCIYQGDNGGAGWRETDAPNFTGSFYSLTKAMMEEALADRPDTYILRLRMPFGLTPHPKNLLTKLAQYPKIVDGLNSLSRVEDVATVAVWFAQHLPPTGIYNVCNSGAITNRAIMDRMGLTKEWWTDAAFAASVAAPRSFCVLNTEKLEAIYPMPSVDEALADCLTFAPA